MINDKIVINQAINALINKDIKQAIAITEQKQGVCAKFNILLKEFFFSTAFKKIPRESRRRLLSKMSNNLHFTDNVCKSFAVEYYYMFTEARRRNSMILLSEGVKVRETKAMGIYWISLEDTANSIAEGMIKIENQLLDYKYISK